MAQDGTTAGGASYTIDNVTFPVGRTKLQSIFNAIRSTNIGNTAPDLVAGQFWIDNNTPSTTVWTMYFYDGTDNISFATIDTTANTVNFIDSTVVTELVNDLSPQLGGTLDANGNNIDMGTNLITDTKVGQWDTAYSWGDHSTQGYLTSETDSQTLSFSSPNLTISNGNSVDLSALDTGITDVVEDTTPQLGGDLDANGNNINIDDDNYLNLGDANEFSIRHEGVTGNTYLRHTTAQPLYIRADRIRITNNNLTETLIRADNNGDVKLYYDNSEKLATTSTGVDVTGTVTATSFSGDGSGLTNLTVTETDPNAIAFAIALG